MLAVSSAWVGSPGRGSLRMLMLQTARFASYSLQPVMLSLSRIAIALVSSALAPRQSGEILSFGCVFLTGVNIS